MDKPKRTIHSLVSTEKQNGEKPKKKKRSGKKQNKADFYGK